MGTLVEDRQDHHRPPRRGMLEEVATLNTTDATPQLLYKGERDDWEHEAVSTLLMPAPPRRVSFKEW